MHESDLLSEPISDTVGDLSDSGDIDFDFSYMESLLLENQQLLEAVSSETVATSTLIAQSNDLLLHIYALQLYFIGVAGACAVLVVLYKFLRKFF